MGEKLNEMLGKLLQMEVEISSIVYVLDTMEESCEQNPQKQEVVKVINAFRSWAKSLKIEMHTLCEGIDEYCLQDFEL